MGPASPLDLAVVSQSAGMVTILTGVGDGTFLTFGTYTVGVLNGPQGIAIGDFDGNGNLDLAVSDSKTNIVHILTGNGNATFQPSLDYQSGSWSQRIVVTNLNGDGLSGYRGGRGTGSKESAPKFSFLLLTPPRLPPQPALRNRR